MNKAIANYSSRQAITPARYNEGTHTKKIITPQQGRGSTITLAHLDGLYMQMHRSGGKYIPSGEVGSLVLTGEFMSARLESLNRIARHSTYMGSTAAIGKD